MTRKTAKKAGKCRQKTYLRNLGYLVSLKGLQEISPKLVWNQHRSLRLAPTSVPKCTKLENCETPYDRVESKEGIIEEFHGSHIL